MYDRSVDRKLVRFHPVVSDDPDNESAVRTYPSHPFDLSVVTYEAGEAKAISDCCIGPYLDGFDMMAPNINQVVAQNPVQPR